MDTGEASRAELAAAVLRYAELELDAERLNALEPVAAQMLASVAAIRAVDVGELPPATAFDARWE